MATVYGVRKENVVSPFDDSPWTGTWDTTYNQMALRQEGALVTGSYEYDEGIIEGTVSGDTLSGTWTERGTRTGRFVFILSPDGKSFVGTYGSGDASTGGEWKGTKR